MKKKKRSISYANYIFTPVESTCIDPMISNRNLEHNIDIRLEQAQGLLRLFLNSEDATVRRGSNLTLTHKQPSIHHLAG